jgi:hypothetical protein
MKEKEALDRIKIRKRREKVREGVVFWGNHKTGACV